jgi:hypothetical protein
MFSSMVQTVPQIKAGKLRAPGSGALERSPALPDVPTIAETSVCRATHGYGYGWRYRHHPGRAFGMHGGGRRLR